MSDIIDFNEIKNSVKDKDVDKFENYIYEMYYSMAQGEITMSELNKKMHEYMSDNNISMEKFMKIQTKMLTRYGISTDDMKSQLSNLGLDPTTVDSALDYEKTRKTISFTEKYKGGIGNKLHTTYKISNDLNQIELLMNEKTIIIKSHKNVNLQDVELNEFICSYKKLYDDEKISVEIFENVNTYEY